MSAKWAGTRRVGFTLIELLVVVSIIALLIAILLPSLKKARTQAKITKCATQLHDIGVALMSYANDYDRFPPQNSLGAPPPDWRSIETVADRQGAAFWTYAVHKELAAHMGGLRANRAGERSKVHEVFYCPDVPDTKLFNTTDNLNMADILSGSYPDGTYTGNPCGFLVTMDGRTFYHPGDTGLFLDMKLIGEMNTIDVAALPIGDNFTMGIEDAVKATEFLQPGVVIPIHYKTFDVIDVEPQEFVDRVSAAGFTSKLLNPGESYDF